MSNFAGGVKRSAPQFSIQNHTAANAGANPHGKQVTAIFPRAQTAFTKRGHIHIIVNHHGHVQLFRHDVAQRNFFPSKIARVNHAALVPVHRAWRANAGGLNIFHGKLCVFTRALNALHHSGDDFLAALGGLGLAA